jgi:hypothetical protein
MKAWRENISGIYVEIDYRDILGEKQEILKRTLHYGMK